MLVLIAIIICVLFIVLWVSSKGLFLELKKNWPTHFITLLIAVFTLFIGYFLIVNEVIIKGHDFKIDPIFRNTRIGSQWVESEPIEIGKGGGYFSVGLRIESKNEKENVKIRYKLSYDAKDWLGSFDEGIERSYEKEIETCKWYYINLSLTPAAYIKFSVALDKEPKLYESVRRIDMKMFKHM